MSGLSLNNNIIRVKVDDQTINFDNAGNLAVKTIDTNQIADNAVGTSQVADSSITKAKIEDVTNMRVLGNTSGSDSAPQEVAVLDEDDLGGDTPDATALATQQSIKAYVDTIGIGVNQTWQAVTRSFTVTYTNDTGKPIMLNVSGSSATDNHKIRITITPSGGSAVQFDLARSTNSGGSVASNGCTIIPNNCDYVLNFTGQTPTISAHELR